MVSCHIDGRSKLKDCIIPTNGFPKEFTKENFISVTWQLGEVAVELTDAVSVETFPIIIPAGPRTGTATWKTSKTAVDDGIAGDVDETDASWRGITVLACVVGSSSGFCFHSWISINANRINGMQNPISRQLKAEGSGLRVLCRAFELVGCDVIIKVIIMHAFTDFGQYSTKARRNPQRSSLNMNVFGLPWAPCFVSSEIKRFAATRISTQPLS